MGNKYARTNRNQFLSINTMAKLYLLTPAKKQNAAVSEHGLGRLPDSNCRLQDFYPFAFTTESK